MLRGYSPIVQTLLGTLFTWGATAAGAALVIFIRGKQVSFDLIFLYIVIFYIMVFLTSKGPRAVIPYI